MHGIENLIDEAAIPVALERRGEPRRLPPVVGRGAYRVVRDALACRVATAASVAIEFMPGALAVQVDDDGDGAATSTRSRRWRRRSAAGSTSVARPGGFRVRAWLPTEGQPPCPAAPLAAH